MVELKAMQDSDFAWLLGESPAAALRAAQVEMLRSPQWRSPYYWAAFTLQGEWR